MIPPNQNTPLSKPVKTNQTIWYNLHLWIGWIAGFPIALVCLTGALLVYSGQITRWEFKELFNIEAPGPQPPISKVLEAFHTPEHHYLVNHIGIPQNPNHSYKAYCTQILPEGNRGAAIFVNPYTGQLTPLKGKFSIAQIITELHRNLIGGKAGQLVVAISSILLAITCIIGVVLWWPLRVRTFARAWGRGQALDWHNALGVIALVPLIVMAITGITFTWGKQIFPFLDKLQGAPSRQETPVVVVPAGGVKLPIQTVADRMGILFPGIRITGVQPSNFAQSPHVFILDGDGHNLSVFMDPYTGEELMRVDGSGNGPVGWYRTNFGKLHTFATYGLFWSTIWGLLSLGGTILVITGMWISVKRWNRSKRNTT